MNYKFTPPLNKRGSNVGTLYSHPGYNKHDLFCQAAAITITDDREPIALPANLISDDEDKEERNTEPQIGPPPIPIPKIGQWNQRAIAEQTPEETPRELHLSPEQKGMTTKNLPAVIEDDDTSVIIDEEDRQKSTPEAELLMAHYRFHHISFSKLQEMAHQGILPKKLAHCKIPSCSALTEVCQLMEVSWQMCHAWIAHWTVARATLTMSRRRSTHYERTQGRKRV